MCAPEQPDLKVRWKLREKAPRSLWKKIDTNSMCRIRPFRRTRSCFFPKGVLRRKCQREI